MAMNLKNASKGNYGLLHEGNPTLEDVRTSCLMRIADAVESTSENFLLMTKEFVQMKRDLEFYKQTYAERGERIEELKRSNSSLRGVITKMKNKNRQE